MSKQFGSLKEKIAHEKAARAARDSAFEKLWAEASAAGYAAGDHMTPRAMIVTDCDGNPLEKVIEGVCGFAWVRVKAANKGFGHWLLKTGRAKRGYYGGAEIWIHAHNQSYERKLKHAQAMAHVLKEAGVEAYASGRLD